MDSTKVESSSEDCWVPIDAAAEGVVRSALLSQGVPPELVDALVDAVADVVDHFLAGRLRPSELSGGDFVEAAARIIQHLTTGKHTSLGSTLPRWDRLLTDSEQSNADDALRVHLPRLLRALYDIRNRRGVGHLPGAVSANRADAELLLTCIKWVLCEFVRLFHTTSHDEAQRIIDRLIVRHVPAVEDFEGVRRVISRRSVSLTDKIVLLLSAAGSVARRGDIAAWARAPTNQFSTALTRLDERNLIHRFEDGRIRLTSLGEHRADELSRVL